MVAVLDFLNCKVDGRPFRSLCRATTVRRRFDGREGVWSYLQVVKNVDTKPLRRLKKEDVDS